MMLVAYGNSSASGYHAQCACAPVGFGKLTQLQLEQRCSESSHHQVGQQLILLFNIVSRHLCWLFWVTAEEDLPFISDYKAAVLQPLRECLSDPIPETPFWDSGVTCVISWMGGMQQYTLHDNETQISRKSKMTTPWDVWVTHLRQMSLSILWSMVVVFGWTNCHALATGLLPISQFFGPCASSWKSQSMRCPIDFCWKNRISGMKGGVTSDSWRGCVLSYMNSESLRSKENKHWFIVAFM